MKKIRILALILAILSVVCIGVLAACDETESDVCADGEHEWKKWESNRDASCETNGTRTRKCAKCGAKETEEEPDSAYGEHTYGSPVFNNDATCETDGTQTYTCLLCKKPKTEVKEGSALGHTYGKVDASSIVNGYATKTCLAKGCGKTARVYEGIVDQNFEGGFTLEDYAEQIAVSTGATVTVEKSDENSYLLISRTADKTLGSNAYGLSMMPDYDIYRNDKYVVEYKILITENTRDLVLLVGAKGDAEQVFAEYDAAEGKIRAQGKDVCDVTKGNWITLAFVLDDQNRNYDMYVDGYKVVSLEAYANSYYYTGAALAFLSINMKAASKTASEFAVDDIKIYEGAVPTVVNGSNVKENATTTVGDATITYVKPADNCEHEYGEFATVSPTCYQYGYQVKTCSKCGGQVVNDDVSTITAKLTHDYEEIAKKDPTCTEDGYLSSKCKYCGDKKLEDALTDHDKYSAKGHKSDDIKAEVTEATCTEGGYTTKHCSVCDKDYQDTFTSALGHDWMKTDKSEDKKYIAPTCVTAGHQYCSRCDAEQDVEALGHDWASSSDVDGGGYAMYEDATCAEEGSKTCKRCGVSETVAKLEHVLKLKADTENKKLCWACTNAGCTHSVDVEYATALPSYTELLAKLTELGSTVMSDMKLTDSSLTGDLGTKTIDKIQYKVGANKWNVLDNGGVDGVDKYVRWYGNSRVSTSNDDHSYINIGTWDKSLNWTDPGVFEFAIRLGEPGADGKYFQGNGMELLFRVTEEGPNKGPNGVGIGGFTADGEFYFGSGSNKVTVTLSKESFTRIALAIDPAAKTIDLYVNGKLTYKGYTFSSKTNKLTEIRLLQSNYNSNIGLNSYYDIANIAIYEGETPTHITGCMCSVINADHVYEVSEVIDPTCTESGYTVKVCKNCGDTIITDEKAANDHDLGVKGEDGNYTSYHTKEDVASTCTEKGYLKAQCKECKEWILIEEYDLAEHDLGVKDEDGKYTSYYEEDKKDATCTEEGYHKAKCKNCEQFITITTQPVMGHTLSETDPDGNTKKDEATCTEKGHEYQWCSVCETWIVSKDIPANGHTWAEIGKEGYTAPTCTEKGQKICTVEGCTATQEIAATGHTMAGVGEAGYTAPTCTEKGTKKCKNCDYTEDIAATGHEYKLSENEACELYVVCGHGCEYKEQVIFAESLPTDQTALNNKIGTSTLLPGGVSFSGLTKDTEYKRTDSIDTNQAIQISGKLYTHIADAKFVIKNGTAEDGVGEYMRWYSNSVGGLHAYLNIGNGSYGFIVPKDQKINDVVFEFAIRLGEPNEKGEYFPGGFQFIDRTGATSGFNNFANITKDGVITVKDGKVERASVQLTQTEFTTIAFAAHSDTNTLDLYVNGKLIAKGLSCKIGSIQEIRFMECSQSNTFGIGSSYDIANIAVYQGFTPVAVLGVDYCAINGHTADGEGVVTAPTCTEKGYTTYTCKFCEESYKADEVSALGHSMVKDEENSSFNCLTGGVLVKKCDNPDCTHTTTENLDAKTAHDFSSKTKDEANSYDATCTAAGYTYYICDECGASGKGCDDTNGYKVTKKYGHKFTNHVVDEVNSAKDCQDGFTYYLCNRCNVSALELGTESGKVKHTHTAEHVEDVSRTEEKAATATENGYLRKYCSVCGDKYHDETLYWVDESQSDFEFGDVDGLWGVTKYTGTSTTIVLPATSPDGQEVRAVGAGAFAGLEGSDLTIVIQTEIDVEDTDKLFWIYELFAEEDDAENYGSITVCFTIGEPDDIDSFLQEVLMGDAVMTNGGDLIVSGQITFQFGYEVV